MIFISDEQGNQYAKINISIAKIADFERDIFAYFSRKVYVQNQ